MPPAIELIAGQRFGRLIIVRRDPRVGLPGGVRWICRCECGEIIIARCAELRSGATKSCDLARHAKSHSQHPLYQIWNGIIQRCTNPNNPRWRRYGGRGIRVCRRWLAFANFVADVGPRPSLRHTIDRYPDNDGDYKPSNVRWATDAQQSLNR